MLTICTITIHSTMCIIENTCPTLENLSPHLFIPGAADGTLSTPPVCERLREDTTKPLIF